jgi:predicted RNase H-like HicB family nuclease
MRKYLVVIEKSKDGYGAFSPDLPGCVAVGDTKKEVRKLMKESIRFHLKGMKEDGLKPPCSRSEAEYLQVSA